ncbi:MAG: hypothetical protein DHS80DRAFT_32191 [Piptocephalis tieghemiana]|nr:MAG: hypothetical protein DHS80DRAFT_32191 [Piptocephalis tieghemiana]
MTLMTVSSLALTATTVFLIPSSHEKSPKDFLSRVSEAQCLRPKRSRERLSHVPTFSFHDANRLALSCVQSKKTLTWAALAQEVSILSKWLSEKGISPGDHLIVCMSASMACVLALLAIGKCGVSCTLLDPRAHGAQALYFLAGQTGEGLTEAHGVWEFLPRYLDLVSTHVPPTVFPTLDRLDASHILLTGEGWRRHLRTGPRDEIHLHLPINSPCSITFGLAQALITGAHLVLYPPASPMLTPSPSSWSPIPGIMEGWLMEFARTLSRRRVLSLYRPLEQDRLAALYFGESDDSSFRSAPCL